MVEKRTDRRVERTRKLLQDALISMMIDKGYEDTAVQDIIDRANVGRATFYAQFADKETLLTSRLEDLRNMLAERQRQSPTLGFSLPMLEHAHSHLRLYQAIVGHERGAFVLRRIHRTIADLALRDVQALGFKGTVEERHLAAEYMAGAFMAVLTWWLDHGGQLALGEVETILRRHIVKGRKQLT